MGNREPLVPPQPEDRAEREAFRALDTLLSTPEPLPAGLLQRTHEMIEERGTAPSRGGLALAGGLAVAILLLLWSPWTMDDRAGRVLRTPTPTFAAQVETALLRNSAASQLFLDSVGDRALGVLHRLARCTDPDAACAAIEQLGHLGRRESLPVLVSGLRKADRRAAAIRALGYLGEARGVAALDPLLEDEVHGEMALAAIVRIGGESAARSLTRRIRWAKTTLDRSTLVAELGRCDGKAGARALLGLLPDPDLGSAAFAALRANEDTLLPHLLAAASRRDDREAVPALEALERLASPASVPTLAKLLDSRRRRGAAARALARIDSADAADALLAASPSAEVREAFRLAGSGIEARLLLRLRQRSRIEKLRVIGLLGRCGSSASVPSLEALATVPALAPEAITALGRIGGLDAANALGRIADQPKLARSAIEALGWTSSEAAVALLEGLAVEEGSLREPAFRALARLGAPDAVAAILKLDEHHPARRRAVRTLRTMDREVVLPALSALLEGEQAAGARKALAALTTH